MRPRFKGRFASKEEVLEMKAAAAAASELAGAAAAAPDAALAPPSDAAASPTPATAALDATHCGVVAFELCAE